MIFHVTDSSCNRFVFEVLGTLPTVVWSQKTMGGVPCSPWIKRCQQGSDQFISFNSIKFQFKLDSGFFNSIPIQIRFRIFQFNSNSIHFLSIPIQFNSNFMHRNKQINPITGHFKFNLNISLFASQFRKFKIQDHKNSRINKSALVQVLG